MEFTYDGIVKWMEDYFKAYNSYAQNPETVNKMSEYFTPDVHFIPYVAEFGGPERAVTSRDDFFRMFTGHPAVYEKFEPEDIMVDEKKKIVVALLKVELFDTKTGEVLLRKSYLPRYQLVLDENNTIKIKSILFFWESLPPDVDKAYGVGR